LGTAGVDGAGGESSAGAGGEGGSANVEPEFFNLPFKPSNLPDTIAQVQVPINEMSSLTGGAFSGIFGSYGFSEVYECGEDANCIFRDPIPKTIEDYSVRVFRQEMANSPEVVVVFVRSFAVVAGEVSITSDRPVIIVSQGPILIDGTLRVSSQGTETSGKGADAEGGSGGGGFCGTGGPGLELYYSPDGVTGQGGPGGTSYGTAELIPLVNGSTGGTSEFWHGGNGGGSLQLVSAESITVTLNGRLVAYGAPGEDGGIQFGGGGGGSGGSILLEAPTVQVDGTLSVAGGDGGLGSTDAGEDTRTGVNGAPGDAVGEGGGGGSGWVRINTQAGTFTPGAAAAFDPATTTACFSAGPLRDVAAQVPEGTVPHSCAEQFTTLPTPCTTCVQTNCCDEMDACFDEALGCADDLRSYYKCPGTCEAFKACVVTDCEGCLDTGN
jgi:hypothetical protein